jgi:translocator assembly and maintenance protein 41
VAWHAANLARNRRHYSLLGAAGPSAVAAVAERVGAGVHFNAFARVDPLGPARVKYGVVALPTLLRDLRDWDALYVAGRMHKPVATLRAAKKRRSVPALHAKPCRPSNSASPYAAPTRRSTNA